MAIKGGADYTCPFPRFKQRYCSAECKVSKPRGLLGTGRGGGGMEVGEEGDCIAISTLSPPE